MGAVIKKELKNYFLTPIGYVVIGIFLVVFSAFFYLTTIATNSVDLTYLFYNAALYGLMFMAPLITMWSFSGERKNGTDQLILTSPVSMLGVVIAKFIAAFLLILIPAILTTMYFGILCYYSVPNIPIYLTKNTLINIFNTPAPKDVLATSFVNFFAIFTPFLKSLYVNL